MSLSFYDNLGYQYNARFAIHELDGEQGSFYISLDKILDSDGNEVTTANQTFGADLTVPDVQDFLKSSIDNEQYQVVWYTNTTGDSQYGIFGKTETTFTEANDLYANGSLANDSTALLQAYKQTQTDGNPQTWKFNPATGLMTTTGTKTAANSAYLKFDPYTGYFAGVGTESAGLTAASSTTSISFPGADNFSTITIDFSNSTMFNNNGTSTVSATSGNVAGLGTGRRLGELSGISISKDGIITGSYDNGQSKILGQIAVAAFANAAGLEKAGDNLYTSTPNSGEFDGIGIDITANGDYMTSGVLEMSNVDLANEFTTMITTQRGFQANSRIITVSDSLLEELTNLKR